MAPNTANSPVPTGVLDESDVEVICKTIPEEALKPGERKLELIWFNVFFFAFLHIVGLYGAFLFFFSANIKTSILAYVMYICGGIGITAGVHRLWSHRAYKAKWPLRLLLCFFNTIVYEDSVIHWARDHRVHHKYSDTDADPHNARRGFFFCHVGWLLCKKHPEVVAKGRVIDISDLKADPILAFQNKYYNPLMFTICFALPTVAPMYLWNESFMNAFAVNIFRYCFTLNATWLVNSAAHYFGNQPYDKFVLPRQNLSVAILALGEGWHNFHHTFPWDYKTSELGKYSTNVSTAFIDFFAKIGWAYDLKTVSPEMIKKRTHRTGDGTHEIWGWGDKDQPKEDYDDATILYRKDN